MNRSRQTDAAPTSLPASRRPRGGLALGALLALACLGFCALGAWQVQRLGWKRDLVARVEARVRAAPVPAPAAAEWPRIDAEGYEYRRVRLEGRYLPGRETRVQAVTEAGAGFWLLAPLRTADGGVVLVNRGFVPPDWRPDPASARTGSAAGAAAGSAPVTVTGLLRISEPGGGFLRRNAPAQERWYSRDVAAIAAARGLARAAPYFVDAERGGEHMAATDRAADAGADPDAARWPLGGLTVVRFRDNHLSYALTWFALALMTVFAGRRLLGEERRRRRRPPASVVIRSDAGHAALPHD